MSATKATIECDISIHECERLAKGLGGTSTFTAEFPVGQKRCEWIDPYMGFVRIDMPELKGKFMTVDQLDGLFPGLKCSVPSNE